MNRLASKAFRDDVRAAREGISMFLDETPNDQMLLSIAGQLDFVLEWSKKGASPDEPQLNDLNFGLMASHSVEDLDPPLAMQLYHLAGEIDDRDG